MKRLNLNPALKLVMATSLMTLSALAPALDLKSFSPAELSALQKQGKPVAVHFHADWCATCVKQGKSFEALKSEAKMRDMTVLIANYDKEKDLRKAMKVKKQSVIVVFRGQQEVARLGGKTGADEIRAELIKAL